MTPILELADMDFKANIITVLKGKFISARDYTRKEENSKLMI